MEKNEVSKAVKDKKKANKADPCEEEVKRSKEITEAIELKEKEVVETEAQIDKLYGTIGNIVGADVPISKDEKDNFVVATWGEPRQILVDGITPGKLHHHEVMQILDIVEFERGQKIAGHRGYFLKGAGVLLNQALINYGLQCLVKKGYVPLQPPFFMKKSIMEETCQLSDFEENLYQVQGSDKNDCNYLIATSEQPISAMYRNEWIEPQALPLKWAGISTCFRKEAGAHGKDVWGIFRIHQFEKVEQFIYADPEKSWEI